MDLMVNSLGIDLEVIEQTMDYINDSSSNSKEAIKVIKKMVNTLMKSIKSNAEIEKSTETLEFGEDSVKATAIAVTMDGAALINIASDMIEYMNTNNDFKSVLSKNLDEYAAMYGGYMDSEEMLEEIYNSLESAAEQLDETAEYADEIDMEICVTFYVSKSGSYLIGVDVNADIDGDRAKMSFYAGPSFENLSEISFKYNADYVDVRGTYTVSTNDKKEYSAKLKIRSDGTTVLTGNIDWDKKDGDFTIEISDGRYSTGVDGTLTQKGKATTLHIDSYEEYGRSYDLGIDIIFKTSDKMPSTPKYTDVLTMKLDDVDDLVDDIQYAMSDIFYYIY